MLLSEVALGEVHELKKATVRTFSIIFLCALIVCFEYSNCSLTVFARSFELVVYTCHV